MIDQIGALIAGALRIMIPIAFGALGCTVSERAGIVNIGLEGMMLMGAFGGVVGSFVTGSAWIGLIIAMIFGMLMAALHAVLTIRFKTGHIISGLGINLLASGLTIVLMQAIWGNQGKSPEVASLGYMKVPGFDNVPILKDIFGSISPMFLLLLAIIVLVWFVMYKTVPGLRLRSIGENPYAADSVGINVKCTQFIAVLISGALAALGGAYLSIGDIGLFSRDMVAGRGYIAMAVTIFGGWNPLGALGGSLIFGLAQSVQIRLQAFNFPVQIVQMLPYVLTILILMLIRRSRGPAASGKSFDREEG
nr:ABC transporter permease [Maliibacterium massiliense]